MPTAKFMSNCGVCGGEYQQGPGRYEGHLLKLYGISCCDTCWHGNCDGWAPHYESRLLAHLEAKGLQVPARNVKGLLPRGPDQRGA